MATLGWNVVGVVVVFAAAFAAGSVALAGLGLDTAIEILASTVVIWHLRDTADERRERRALLVIGWAFVGLAIYVTAQAANADSGDRPHHSPLGIGWTAATSRRCWRWRWRRARRAGHSATSLSKPRAG